MSRPKDSGLSSRTIEIRNYLLKTYPCAEIPQGDLAAIGLKFGVTREWIRQQAKILGMLSGVSRRPHCAGCGKIMENKTKAEFCYACRWMEIPCDTCGKLIRRRIAEVAYRTLQEKRPQKYWFCNNSCKGSHAGKTYGFGPQQARKAQQGKESASRP